MEVHFLIDKPKMNKRLLNKGEDAPPVSKDGIMIICDGTGATGQSEHEISGEIYTSAYLGSRKTSEITEKFLSENYKEMMDSFLNPNKLYSIGQEFGNVIQQGLWDYVKENKLGLTVRGKSFKLLPTTLTAVVYKVYEDYIDAIVLCAGDSRALWWDSNGLHQLSSDDNGVEGDISVGDCNISNCVSADSDFHINFLCHRLPAKGILIVTSDGFTDPIRPYDQERYLIEWIGGFDGVSEANSGKLSEKISESIDGKGFTYRDDCSISGVIVGYQSDGDLKEDFRKRFPYLRDEYIIPYQELKRKNEEIEKEQNDLQEKISKNTENFIPNVKNAILECINDRKNFENSNERLQLVLTIVRQEIEEINSAIKKEKEDKQHSIDANEMTLQTMYLDFLKKLCREFGSKKRKFPPEVIWAIQSDFRFQNYCNLYNDSLLKVKNLTEIKNNDSFDSFFWGDVRKVDDICNSLISLKNVIINLKGSRHFDDERTINNYFDFWNKEVEQFYNEDFKNRFSILKSVSFRSEGEKELSTMANTMLTIYDTNEELKKSIDKNVMWERRISEYQKLIVDRIDEVVDKLDRKGVCDRFIPQEMGYEYADLTEKSRNLQTQLEDVINKIKDIWSKYSPEYQAYLSQPISIHVQKKEDLK